MQEVGKTSIKGMFQDMADKGASAVVLGTVTSDSPLKVQVENDAMLTVGEGSIYVPEHLKDHEVEVTVDWETEEAEKHVHAVKGRKKVTVHSGLKKGDKVHLLSFGHGKQYFVLGRA